MADRRPERELPSLALQLVGILPEVQRPSSTVPHCHKVAYTAVSLLIYLVGSQLPVYRYGVRRSPSAADSQYWVDLPDCNSVMSAGIMPLVLSEALLHFLLCCKVLRVNNHEDQMLFANIFWKAFSPCTIKLYGGQHADQHGEAALASSLIHRFVGNGNYKLSWMHKGFGCRDLPEMASVLTTCAFFLLVLSLQGFHATLPLRSSVAPSMQVNIAIKLSYLSFAPLLFHFQDALAKFLYIISELLFVKFGENNKVVISLGEWKKSTTPRALADAGSHPFHTLVHAVWQLVDCCLSSLLFFTVCSRSELYVGRLLGERRNVTVAQPDTVPLELWKCYAGKAALLVGLCIGALTVLAGLAGVVGSGTGIMLAVTVLYSCLEETGYGGEPASAFGF